MRTYEFERKDGSLIEVDAPDDMPFEEVAKRFRRQFIPAEGAPTKMRLIVDSAKSDKDRLATLRKYHPDAEPHPTHEFIYTDEDGQRVLFNKPGFTLSDTAGYARVIPEAGGAALGALAGLTAGPVGSAVGAGLGGAGGGELFDRAMSLFADVEDSRDAKDRLVDTALDIGLNALGGPTTTRAGAALSRNQMLKEAPLSIAETPRGKLGGLLAWPATKAERWARQQKGSKAISDKHEDKVLDYLTDLEDSPWVVDTEDILKKGHGSEGSYDDAVDDVVDELFDAVGQSGTKQKRYAPSAMTGGVLSAMGSIDPITGALAGAGIRHIAPEAITRAATNQAIAHPLRTYGRAVRHPIGATAKRATAASANESDTVREDVRAATREVDLRDYFNELLEKTFK